MGLWPPELSDRHKLSMHGSTVHCWCASGNQLWLKAQPRNKARIALSLWLIVGEVLSHFVSTEAHASASDQHAAGGSQAEGPLCDRRPGWVGAAAAQGVFHRDLKLENTLIDRQPSSAPRLKICDFGYSKHAVNDSQPKSVKGTVAYLAPEVPPPPPPPPS